MWKKRSAFKILGIKKNWLAFKYEDFHSFIYIYIRLGCIVQVAVNNSHINKSDIYQNGIFIQ